MIFPSDVDTRNHWHSAQLGRAWIRASRGQYEQAVDDAKRLTETTGLTCYNQACVFSLSARAAAEDPRISDAKRRELAEHYAWWSIRQLAQAEVRGFFDESRIERMKHDPDFDYLRQREDYRKIIVRVERDLELDES